MPGGGGEATNSSDELSKWGGTVQPLGEEIKKHPKTHLTSTTVHPTKDKMSNLTVHKLVSKVMSHNNASVKEEEDQIDRCSSMESEALKGYV